MFPRISSVILCILTTAWLAHSPAWNSLVACVGAILGYAGIEVVQYREAKKKIQEPSCITGKPDEPLIVHLAHYGAEASWRDVTKTVREHVQEGRLSMIVTNAILGGDPAEWKVKQLKIEYSFHGVSDIVTVKEGDRLQLP